MAIDVRIRLWIMMFLEFFVWGAWSVTLFTYLTTLNFSGDAIGWAFSTTSIAAMLSPFLVGTIADRFLPGQIVMGIMHLLGGVLLFFVSRITDPWPFFFGLLAYSIFYMPTLSLVNAIAFNQMKDPGKEFPAIRVLGTIGWIAAGNLVSFLGLEASATTLVIASGASIALGLFSFALPNTPPKGKGDRVSVGDMFGLKALAMFKDPSFAVFGFSSLLICIPLAFYYASTNGFLNELKVPYAAGLQTLGQVSEIFFMLIMPFFLVRLGVKKMLLIGMIAWAVRYVAFYLSGETAVMPLLLFGIVLHGICYDFFFVTGQIYVDRKAPANLRASAQGLIALLTYGAGMFIGSVMQGYVVKNYEIKEGDLIVGHVWPSVWIVPAIMAVVIAILFAVTFREKPEDSSPAA